MKIAGSDGFNIAGHKISWTMIGALAAAIGAFLVWRQFQAGGVSAGAASTGTSSSGVSASAGDLATDPVIMNLTQELGKTQADLAAVGGGSPPSSGMFTVQVASGGKWFNKPGGKPIGGIGTTVPVLADPNFPGWLEIIDPAITKFNKAAGYIPASTVITKTA